MSHPFSGVQECCLCGETADVETMTQDRDDNWFCKECEEPIEERKGDTMKTIIVLVISVLLVIGVMIFARIAWADDYLVSTSTGQDGHSSAFVSGPNSYYGQGSTVGGSTMYTDGKVEL